MNTKLKTALTAIIALLAATGCTVNAQQAAPAAAAPAAAASAETVLVTGETILGQPIVYPSGDAANVTAVIVTLPPGATTGWHHHDVPLFGYLLEGELAVDYDGAGQRVYRPGEALMEAIGTSHNGRNLTDSPVRILAVFIGADSIPNTVAGQ